MIIMMMMMMMMMMLRVLLFFRANGTMILDHSIESTSGNVDTWSIGAYTNTFQCTFLHKNTKL